MTAVNRGQEGLWRYAQLRRVEGSSPGTRRKTANFALLLALSAFLWLCLGETASAEAPANDDFANAEVLSGLSASTTGTNVDATSEPGEPNHAVVGSGHSVWWTWTAPSDGDFTVDTCGSALFNTVLAVYTGSSVAALTEDASNDYAFDNCGVAGAAATSKLSFEADSGQVYKIAVDGVGNEVSGETGGIALALYKSPEPANDDFADAAALPVNEFGNTWLVGRTNAGASKEVGEPNHAGDPGGRSVWWSLTASHSGVVYLSSACFQGDLDTLLAIYTGSSVNSLTPVASNDDSCAEGSAVSFRANAGQTYHIAVDGAGGAIGSFNLAMGHAPANDDFENAAPLSGPSPNGFGVNATATSEPGEPDHAGNASGRSLWWRWTAPATESVQIDTCGGYGPDTVLAVYTGDAVDALSLVASNDDLASCAPGSGVTFTASAGTTYQIAVDSAAGSNAGYIGLSIHAPLPSNDFSFGKVTKNESQGTAKLRVDVPGPGEIDLAETHSVKADHVSAQAAGTEVLMIETRGGARRKLNSLGLAQITAKVTYTPGGGESRTRKKEIRLVKR